MSDLNGFMNSLDEGLRFYTGSGDMPGDPADGFFSGDSPQIVQGIREFDPLQKENAAGVEAERLAHQSALNELRQCGIDPNSRAGIDFLLRVNFFGIMGAAPPRQKLNK